MRTEKGFTLIELLTVIVVLGILSALALPQLISYKESAFDARALADLRSVVTAQEAYFVDSETYGSTVESLPGLDGVAAGVTINITANAVSWTGQSYHLSGTETFCYDSATDQTIQTQTGTNTPCS